MRLSDVNIFNFCSCEAVAVPLSDFNPIVGYNNSGKSNILRAINWLLKKSLLPTHMFYNSQNAVTVEGVIENVDLTLLPANQQAAVAPFVHNGGLKVRRKQDANVSSVTQVKLEVFDHGTMTWSANPAGLDPALGVLFPEPLYIEAMEDASEDVGKVGAKNTIGLLLKRVLEKIHQQNAEAVATMRQALAQVSNHLNGETRMAELDLFESEASDAIASFFPGLSFHVNFSTPAIDDLFKASTINLSDAMGSSRPFTSFGHGAQRSAHMALIKLLADLNGAAAANVGGTTVLLIDEPELYLHPQAIELLRTSLLQLSTQNFQVVFSTHSPLLVGKEHALQTLMIYKDQQHRTVARQKLQSAVTTMQAHPHQAEVVFSLQNATHLLFSDHVLLVEGKTESMLIPHIYQISRGHSYAHDKGCFVPGSGSGALVPLMQILRAVGFSPKAVADLDFAFKIAPQAQLINPAHPAILACKAWFVANAAAIGVFLDTENLPTKRAPQTGTLSLLTAAEAFEQMAIAQPAEVREISDALIAHGIWLWQAGAIEAHLGIGKNDTERVQFMNTATQSGNLNHAHTPADLNALAQWM
jgi:putative ATP-dependent endonuclease of OLD family